MIILVGFENVTHTPLLTPDSTYSTAVILLIFKVFGRRSVFSEDSVVRPPYKISAAHFNIVDKYVLNTEMG